MARRFHVICTDSNVMVRGFRNTHQSPPTRYTCPPSFQPIFSSIFCALVMPEGAGSSSIRDCEEREEGVLRDVAWAFPLNIPRRRNASSPESPRSCGRDGV